MTTIRILKPEDVTLPEPMLLNIDREEAEENYQRALAATESLKQYVDSRDQALFPEADTAGSRVQRRRIGFINW